jgi:hypothetical protein
LFLQGGRLKAGGSVTKTSTGWIKTWDQWWIPQSYGDCRTLAFDRPKYSSQLVIANAAGTVISTKKHYFRVTCP